MNANELVEYQNQIDVYIKESKMTDFFEYLTRLLVLSRPVDPIRFLVEVLEHRSLQRLILVNSVIAPKRNEVVQAISNAFNYKIIQVDEILAEKIKGSNLRDPGWLSDDLINSTVFDHLKKTEKHHRGIIVCGYPSNLQQALFLQQNGIIPERFFLLNNAEDFCKSYYEILYDHSLREQNIHFTKDELDNHVQCALKRDMINKKELQITYGDFIDEFDFSKRPKEDIVENLKQIIKLRDRKQPPLRFPRVIIVRPPKLKERAHQLVDIFSKRYGMKPCYTFSILEDQIKQKTEIGKYIQKCLLEKIPIPNDIINSLVYTTLQTTEAKCKGWILEGFPKNSVQLNAVDSYNFYPNLILILTEDDDVLLNKIEQIKIDPLTQVLYESISIHDKTILSRLKNYIVPDELKLKDEIWQYLDYVRKLEEIYGDRVQQFKLDKDSLENIIRITDVFLNNPKIYS